MEQILGVLGKIPNTKTRNDDDFSDRLLYRHTSALFVLFAIVVSTKQYVGDPIQCWVPAEFTGNHEEYTNNFCWIRNTYYLPYEKNIPKEYEHDKRQIIPYYQWMPMILAIQGLLCYLPILLWRCLNDKSGIDVNTVVEAGEAFTNAEIAESREKTLTHMTRQLDRYLSNQKDVPKGCTISLKQCFSHACCSLFGRHKGNYLMCLYLIVKVLALASVFGQLFALNFFLGQDFHMYGFDAIHSMITGTDVSASPRFPRVTMCDFKIRRLGNVQRYTVQCVLPINLFNEKIYLFVWFWLAFVSAILSFSLISWIARAVMKSDKHRYIRKHLHLMEKLQRDSDKKNAVKFVEDYLKQDGVFILRLVGHNTNALTVTEFVGHLWDNYRVKPLTDRIEKELSEV
ncbi:hypothetical protein HELRODRAFT_185033 [Helobdella robusta]|uniref:Innexin n=1 Tax=Helobdella robusta TaxID=6412 RepID=T1FMB3_HELRO|nr:hypothetical protein HELRODRAFT_185033 [Helobdella robusta]ESN98774.1 hypothetical protein HELRODRAFT_185033 [Helobdella robusta]